MSDPQIVQYDGHAWVRLGEWQKLEAEVARLREELDVATQQVGDVARRSADDQATERAAHEQTRARVARLESDNTELRKMNATCYEAHEQARAELEQVGADRFNAEVLAEQRRARVAELERDQVTPAMQAEFELGKEQRDQLRARVAELEAYGTPAHQGYSCEDTEQGHAAWMQRAERAESALASARELLEKAEALTVEAADGEGLTGQQVEDLASYALEALKALSAHSTTGAEKGAGT